MNSSGFLTNEQVAELRADGKIALSLNACRLMAFSGSTAFLISQINSLDKSTIFSISNLEQLKNQYLILFQIFISYIAIYLGIFLATILVQSSFYLSFSKIFKSNRPFFDLSGVSGIFSLYSLLRLLFVSVLLFVTVCVWFNFVPQVVVLYFAEDYAQALTSSCLQIGQLLAVYAIITVITVIALIFIAKLMFRLDNTNLGEKR